MEPTGCMKIAYPINDDDVGAFSPSVDEIRAFRNQVGNEERPAAARAGHLASYHAPPPVPWLPDGYTPDF